MNRGERKERIGLIFWLSVFIFAVLFAAVIVAAVIIAVLSYTGVILEESVAASSLSSILLWMVAFSVFMGVIVSILGSKICSKPINRYLNQMNRLASGDFKARFYFQKSLSKYSAFQEFEESFNKTARELEQTELLHRDFINNFSHEFKTPIVSIAGFAKLLRRGNLTDEQQQEYLAAIEEESLRLAELSSSVLELSKIENQTILTNVTGFNLGEQIRSAMLLLEDKWTKKHIDLSLHLGEYAIIANEELLRHVWINLLDNAIKFSEDYGCIEVDTTEKDDKIVVAISNSGVQIPPECGERIFMKFYQADESRSTQGNGIGLAIVKKVVTLHGGTVQAESKEMLTTFVVELPKRCS